ncbi:dTDP-4-dehydrorhamnose reductase [Amycolatopsis sp. PS_44_ISF1]|uniref:dTDP-4-dehydrorhamnose reductase n=1 Tax=Amycolatopsis sp. PS_44_ISF1 TaxID=2974917 RepID=UPI0028DF793B|nr:dTDP-4-dehydrorhamnose reductase [Amycolatopsis sp. PS_44_ISF1]MDT8909468.1 dTDP-4-dehydrorhamnose reductase [Amycolatopsis sp. PS_44_ISF1]
MRLALLVPGGSGQLGRDLAAKAGPDVEVLAPSSAELNLTSAGDVLSAVGALATRAAASGAFPVVLNAAAYTAVDAAETDESRAFAVNADGPRVLAAACASRRVPLVHVSTDYVFPGDSSRPYEVTDPLGPRTAYGRTKAAGEDAVLGSGARAWVVRTSWVYGHSGKNFVKTMARLERERDTLSVVDDQIGSPTWSADLATGLVELAGSLAQDRGPASPVLHCSGAGEVSWCGFAQAIFAELGADPGRVRPCATADYPLPAPRPAYSVLSDAAWRAAGLTPLRHWEDALKAYFAASA